MVAAALAAAGCVRDNAAENQGSRAAADAPPPPLDLTGDAPWPEPYRTDPAWTRAAGGDDFDHARLGRREGAEALVAAVREGGSLGRVALAALPYAADRHAARGPLCALLPRLHGPSLWVTLSALLDAVMGAPRTEDTIDPAVDALCGRALEEAARREPAEAGASDLLAALIEQLHAP